MNNATASDNPLLMPTYPVPWSAGAKPCSDPLSNTLRRASVCDGASQLDKKSLDP